MTALLADCGGTFARFALLRDGRLGEPVALQAAMFEDFVSAAAFFLDGEGTVAVEAIAVGAAGPVEDGRIAMTNGCRWTIDPAALRERFGAGRALAVNDFAAVAAALPHLTPEDSDVLFDAEPQRGAARLAIGAGTGLGVGAAIPDGRGGHVVASGEAGHVALAPATDRELAIVFQLMRTIGHVKAEAVLSGPGSKRSTPPSPPSTGSRPARGRRPARSSAGRAREPAPSRPRRSRSSRHGSAASPATWRSPSTRAAG